MIGYRNMLCGMHVHVEVPDISTRINLIMRLTPYLPLLLALSTSSPFWQGHLDRSVRLSARAYDELPRTGLPELFRTKDDYDQFVAALIWAKIIPDASYIWWALRPSLPNPTVELRVADSCTQLDDAVAIAALFRCLVRALDRDRSLNSGFDRVGRAITMENKWHAQRYGIAATFVDPFARSPLTAQAMARSGVRLRRRGHRGARLRGGNPPPAPDIGGRHQRRPPDRHVRQGQEPPAGRRLTAIKDVIDWAAQETQSFGPLNDLNPENRAGLPLARFGHL